MLKSTLHFYRYEGRGSLCALEAKVVSCIYLERSLFLSIFNYTCPRHVRLSPPYLKLVPIGRIRWQKLNFRLAWFRNENITNGKFGQIFSQSEEREKKNQIKSNFKYQGALWFNFLFYFYDPRSHPSLLRYRFKLHVRSTAQRDSKCRWWKRPFSLYQVLSLALSRFLLL